MTWRVTLLLAVVVGFCVSNALGQRHPASSSSYPKGKQQNVGSATADTKLVQTLLCPVCDYGVAHIAKEVVSMELFCRQSSVTSVPNLCENFGKRNRVSYELALELLLDACDRLILEVFPATEIMYHASDAQARADLHEKQNANTVEPHFLGLIERACRKGVDRRRAQQMARNLTDLAWSLPDPKVDDRTSFAKLSFPYQQDIYLNVLPLEARRNIYESVVLVAQERFCATACGTIPRPRTLSPPRAVGFNAHGVRVYANEHLTFDEAERMRQS